MKKLLLKIVSYVLVVAFVSQNLVWADPEIAAHVSRKPAIYDLQAPIFNDTGNPEFARHFLRTALLQILATGQDLSKLGAPLTPFYEIFAPGQMRVELQINPPVNPPAETAEGGALVLQCSVAIGSKERREFTATIDPVTRSVTVDDNGLATASRQAAKEPLKQAGASEIPVSPAAEKSGRVKAAEGENQDQPLNNTGSGSSGTIMRLMLFLLGFMDFLPKIITSCIALVVIAGCGKASSPGGKKPQDHFDGQGNYVEYHPASGKLKRVTYANGDVTEYAEEPMLAETGAVVLEHKETEARYAANAYDTMPGGLLNRGSYVQTVYLGDYSDSGLSKGSPVLSGVNPGEMSQKVGFGTFPRGFSAPVLKAIWKEEYSGGTMDRRTTYHVDLSDESQMFGLPSSVTTAIPDGSGIDRYEYYRELRYGQDTPDRSDDRGRVLTWRLVTPTPRAERVFFSVYGVDGGDRPLILRSYSSPEDSYLTGFHQYIGEYVFYEGTGRLSSFEHGKDVFPDGSYRGGYVDEDFYPASDMLTPTGRLKDRFYRKANVKGEIAFSVREFYEGAGAKKVERSFADEQMSRPLFDYFYGSDGQLLRMVDLNAAVVIDYTVTADDALISVADDKMSLTFNRATGVIGYREVSDGSASVDAGPNDARYLYFASLAEDKLWHALKQAKGTANEEVVKTACNILHDEARAFFPVDTGKDIWLGVNYMGPLGAESYGQDFGTTAWYPEGNGISAHADTVAYDLERMAAARIARLRMWLVCDGRSLLDDKAEVSGYNEACRKDIKAMLDMAHAKGLRMEFSLVDFYIAYPGEWVGGVYLGGRKNLFSDPATGRRFISNFLVPFLQEFGRHPALQTIDLGNELGFVRNFGVDPLPLLKGMAAAIRKHAPHLKITVNLRTDQVRSFAGLTPYLDHLQVHWYPGVKPSLDDIKGYLDGLGIPWGLGEVPSSGSDTSVLEYYIQGIDRGAEAMAPWNWNPGLDDATFPDAAARDAAFEAIRQFNIERNTPVPEGVSKAEPSSPPVGSGGDMTGHAFRPLSFYSIFGLGGGIDWTIYGIAAASGAAVSSVIYWQALSGLWISALIIGALSAAVLAATAANRVYGAVSAALAAHPDFTIWRALTHDIGHDEPALAVLRQTAPDVWFDIRSHELYGYHVPGLLAFVPSARSNERVSRIDAYLRGKKAEKEASGRAGESSTDVSEAISRIQEGISAAAAAAGTTASRAEALRGLENEARALLAEPGTFYSGPNIEVVTNAGRLDIIPDIHADYGSLIEHLKARGLISVTSSGAFEFHMMRGDVIVFQGDITGRGTEDVEVIRFMTRIKAEADAAGARVVFLEGNHDYYLRILFRAIAERHDNRKRVDLEWVRREMSKILTRMSADRLSEGYDELLVRLYNAYRPKGLAGKIESLRHGDFYAAYSRMLASGVVDHYNGLKRLAVVDNHVISHTLLPYSVDDYIKSLPADTGEPGGDKFIRELKGLDTHIGTLYDDQLAGYYPDPNDPYAFGPIQAWLYYTKVIARVAPDNLRAIRERLYAFMRGGIALPPGASFRMYIGHDPDKNAVTLDPVSAGGDDLLMCDGGMCEKFRSKGMNGGIVEVSPEGKIIAHQPLRREGEEPVVVVFKTKEDNAAGLLPSLNADVRRLLARIEAEEKKDMESAEKGVSGPAAAAAADDTTGVEPPGSVVETPSEDDKPCLTDFKDPKALAHNVIAVMLSVALSGKRPVLAFHKDVSGKSGGAIRTLLDKLDDLKKKEGFDKILKNMVIIRSFESADELRSLLGDDVDVNDEKNAVFTFAAQTAAPDIRGRAVHNVVINEGADFNADLFYYPLFEIVTMALIKYLKGYDSSDLNRILGELNITPEDINIGEILDDSGAFLVFRLLPRAERARDGSDRYALLRRYISAAA